MAHLRPWHFDHAARLLEIIASTPDLVRELPELPDLDAAQEWCAAPNDYDGRWRLAIVDDGVVVGNVAVDCKRRHRIGWLAYWLAADARGRGLMTRAVATMCDIAVHELDLHRLEIGYRVDNPASAGVARRCGFVVEGRFREELEYDGVRHDTEICSRLPGDPAVDVDLLDVEG